MLLVTLLLLSMLLFNLVIAVVVVVLFLLLLLWCTCYCCCCCCRGCRCCCCCCWQVVVGGGGCYQLKQGRLHNLILLLFCFLRCFYKLFCNLQKIRILWVIPLFLITSYKHVISSLSTGALEETTFHLPAVSVLCPQSKLNCCIWRHSQDILW